MPVIGGEFDFSIEVRHSGMLLGSEPASLGICFEDALLRGILLGCIPNDGSVPPCVTVPEWAKEGPPTVTGLGLSLGDMPAGRYDRDVLAPQANALIDGLARTHRLDGDETVEWRVVAHPSRSQSARFAARTSRRPLPLRRASLPGLAPGELAVEIDADVLARISAQSLQTASVERAWLLLGRFLHDAEREAGRLEITRSVEIAAGPGGASSFHFPFQPRAFIAARRSVEGESDALVPLGWGHSHPSCADCLMQPSCDADTVFFSSKDTQVHSTAFPSAYMVALVAGKLRHLPATQPGFRLYGWSRGQVRERSYLVHDRGSEAFLEVSRDLEVEVDR